MNHNIRSDIRNFVSEYTSSTDLAATNRLCRGFMRRLHHCSAELITRKDSGALDQHYRQGEDLIAKQRRYEIRYRVLRQAAGVWAEQAFTSYQREALTNDDAHKVILATHCVVGLFFRRNDPHFYWTEFPINKTTTTAHHLDDQELIYHKVDSPLTLSCVPRAHFLDRSQTFESTPGYAINLTFRSRCRDRKQYEWKRVVSLQSKQTAPLTLALAEHLLWDSFNSVNSALSALHENFRKEHEACEFLEGVIGCQHSGDDALDIELTFENKLGPNFGHLRRSIESKLGLFRDPDARDCKEFFQTIHSALVRARNTIDCQVEALPDLDLRITALSAPTWSVENPVRFLLCSSSHSRQRIEALLDRVQTGFSDVITNKICTVHLVAYKRGHLVLDTTLPASPLLPESSRFAEAVTVEQADALSAQLAERFRHDIDAICMDTCTLDGISDSAPHNDDLSEYSDMDYTLLKGPAPILQVHGVFEKTFIYQDPVVYARQSPLITLPQLLGAHNDVSVHIPEPSLPQSPALDSRHLVLPLETELSNFSLIISSDKMHSTAVGSICTVADLVDSASSISTQMPVELIEAPAEVCTKIAADRIAEHSTNNSEDNCAIDDNCETSNILERLCGPVSDFNGAEISCTVETLLPAADVLDQNAKGFEAQVCEESFGDAPEADDSIKTENVFKNELNGTLILCPVAGAISNDDLDAETAEDINDVNVITSECEERPRHMKLDSPPNFINFDDFEEQQTVGLFLEHISSPVIGPFLTSVVEYESIPEAEFDFELPSYGHFHTTSQDLRDESLDKNDEAALSNAVSYNCDEEHCPDSTVGYSYGSLYGTRPSTPSLSSSYGDVDTPESSGSPDFDFEFDNPSPDKYCHFDQFQRDLRLARPSQQNQFYQALSVSLASRRRDSLEFEHSPTEGCHDIPKTSDIQIMSEQLEHPSGFDAKPKISNAVFFARRSASTLDIVAAMAAPASCNYPKHIAGSNDNSEPQLVGDEDAKQAFCHNEEAARMSQVTLHDFDRLQDQVNSVDPVLEATQKLEACSRIENAAAETDAGLFESTADPNAEPGVVERQVDGQTMLDLNEQPAYGPYASLETDTTPLSLLHLSVEKDAVKLGGASGPSLVATISPVEERGISLSLDSAHEDGIPSLLPEQSTGPERYTTSLSNNLSDSTEFDHETMNADNSASPKRSPLRRLPRSGFLGLRETHPVRFSFRYALTGSYAFDSAPFSTKKHQKTSAVVEEVAAGQDNIAKPDSESTAATPSKPLSDLSVQSETVVDLLKSSLPELSDFGGTSEDLEATADTTHGQQGALSRVIIAFISITIISRMINRSL
ncbi:hypothetical protein SEPCBS119000_004578 [Sporothrix epigloea]|uniref:Pt repeat family protein n=1 Tax=Sporothrix epigloea TaxID=1892477 RepID=A0ABP0DSW8_9PEZI